MMNTDKGVESQISENMRVFMSCVQAGESVVEKVLCLEKELKI